MPGPIAEGHPGTAEETTGFVPRAILEPSVGHGRGQGGSGLGLSSAVRYVISNLLVPCQRRKKKQVEFI